MIATRRQNNAKHRRRGFHTIELLFALPVLALLLLAILEFAQLLTVRFGVTHAATIAARELGKGGDVADVTRAVNAVLATYGMAVTGEPGSGAKVAVQDGLAGTAEYGDPTMLSVPPEAIQPDEVLATVWIRFDAKRADGQRLLARPLGFLGDLLGGGRFCISSLAKKDT
jgi:hypothetical protein